MKYLICIGSGGLAREVTSLIREEKKFQNFSLKSYCFSSSIVEEDDLFPPIRSLPTNFYYVVAVGNPQWKAKCINQLHKNSIISAQPINIIHSSSYISKSSNVRENSGIIIFPNSVVMNGVTISSNSMIGSSAVVEHDSYIGINCTISPNVTICGNVVVGDNCCVGAGSTLIQGVKLGSSSVIGAHSLINKDIESSTLAYGVPARPIKKIDGNFKYF